MKLRVNEMIEVETFFQVESLEAKVAPLLFIPLIENTFKHGVNPNEKSVINIMLSEKKHLLTFVTGNLYFPQKYKNDDEKEKAGIGLANLRKRLQLIYPDKHTFSTECDGKTYKVVITIDL